MPNAPAADVGELLRRLTQAQVEFIVVGGAAAVLHADVRRRYFALKAPGHR